MTQPDDELDPIDHIIAEVEQTMDEEQLAFLRMFGEMVRAMYIMAFAMDDIKDTFSATDDMVKH